MDFKSLAQQIVADLPFLDDKIQSLHSLQINSTKLLEEMLRFLFLVNHSKQILTPSLLIDLVWHEFILCTKYYAAFCEKYFHTFIHHYPGGEGQDNHTQYKLTLTLYTKLYNSSPNADIWGSIKENNFYSNCGLDI